MGVKPGSMINSIFYLILANPIIIPISLNQENIKILFLLILNSLIKISLNPSFCLLIIPLFQILLSPPHTP